MNIDFFKIARKLLYIFVFTFPLFFIPGMNFFLQGNKLLFLGVFSFLIFIFCTLDIIKKGKLVIKEKLIAGSLFIFYLFFFISAILNNDLTHNFHLADSFFAFIFYLLLFLSARCLIKEKSQMKTVGYSFVLGVTISVLIFLFNLPDVFIMVDNVDILALLSALSCVFILSFYRGIKKNELGILVVINFLVLLGGMFVINSRVAWFALTLGALLILWKSLKKKDFIIPLVVTLLATILFLGNFSFSFEKNYETDALSFSSSSFVFDIGTHESLFGYGSASFDKNYIAYNSSLGDVYDKSGSAVINVFSDFGIVGGLAFIYFLASFIFIGFKRFFNNENNNCEFLFFNVSFVLAVVLFIYPIDLILTSFFFIFLGMFSSAISKEKIIEFKDFSSNKMVMIIGGIALVLFAISVLIYALFCSYLASYNYNSGLMVYASDEEAAIEYFKASDSDSANIALSQIYLLKADKIYDEIYLLNTKAEADESLKTAKEFAEIAKERGYLAVQQNPYNYYAWENLGNVYLTVSDLLGDTDLKIQAIEAYKEALELAPNENNLYVKIIETSLVLGNREEAELYTNLLTNH